MTSTLHALASRSQPYGYGRISSPSHANCHSLVIQRRAPSALQRFVAVVHDFMWLRGRSLSGSTRSVPSMQKRLWTRAALADGRASRTGAAEVLVRIAGRLHPLEARLLDVGAVLPLDEDHPVGAGRAPLRSFLRRPCVRHLFGVDGLRLHDGAGHPRRAGPLRVLRGRGHGKRGRGGLGDRAPRGRAVARDDRDGHREHEAKDSSVRAARGDRN